MKIGFDAKRAFNNHRGLGNYSREVLRVLTSLSPEHHYYLFTPAIDPELPYSCPENARIIKPEKATGKLAQALWRARSITKEAQALGLDLYHGLSHEIPQGMEKTKIKTVVTMHDLLFIKHPEWYPFLDRMSYRKRYLDSCYRADRIIAVSEQTKRDLLEETRVTEDRVEVVCQGCHPIFREHATEEQKKQLRAKYQLPETYLLNVAATEPRKNQKLLLTAMVAGQIDCPLVIAGRKTDYLNELRQITSEYGLEGQVIFLPDFPFTELPALYQGATLFLFPSIYEGFGIPIIEALESGLPVIAATGSCLEESAGPDSRFADPYLPEAWAEEINLLLHDEGIRTAMSVKGKAYARRFSDEAINEQLNRIYKTLLP